MYSSVSDLLKILPEYEALALADDDNVGSINAPDVQAVLLQAIEQADREIDAYVGTVQAVPLAPVPALVGSLSSKLAVHHLYLRREGRAEPEIWQRETARCMRLLESIATGKMALGGASGATTEPSQGRPAWEAPGRVMDGAEL